MRANTTARESASQKNIDIRYYSVIYDLVDDITKAEEVLSPEIKETFTNMQRYKSFQNNWGWKNSWMFGN